jgi:hypothetical protein
VNAELADLSESVAQAAHEIATAITPDAHPGHDETGGTVASLTEAVMGMTTALVRIAQAIELVAAAVAAHMTNPPEEPGGVD